MARLICTFCRAAIFRGRVCFDCGQRQRRQVRATLLAAIAAGAVAMVVVAFLALPTDAVKLKSTNGDWQSERDISEDDIRPNAPSVFMETSSPRPGAR